MLGQKYKSITESSRGKTAYRTDGSRSRKFFDMALKCYPGGNTRHTLASSTPVYVKSGWGCRIQDVEGEERIDFVNNYSSLILGHANPVVLEPVREQLALGTCFGMPTEIDLELAALLINRVKGLEKIRFCNSGSEAVMLAIKAARAYKGRPKIAKFEGTYHGIYDYAQVSEAPQPNEWGEPENPSCVIDMGSPPSVKNDVVVMPWNNPEACEAIIERHKKELSAVLVDTLPARMGMIPPRPGFLERVRDVARSNGILLILDEVLTFRLSYSGTSQVFGLDVDIAALGKIIGGGFPVGAVGGKAGVMEVFDQTKKNIVHHGGTFNANPMTMAAGLATMKNLTPQVIERLNEMGDYLRNTSNALFKKKKFKAQIIGKGSLFCFHPTDEELVDYRSLMTGAKDRSLYRTVAHEMLKRGIFICPNLGFGCLSTPMEQKELDFYIDSLMDCLHSMN